MRVLLPPASRWIRPGDKEAQAQRDGQRQQKDGSAHAAGIDDPGTVQETAASEPRVLQSVRVLAIDAHWVCFEEAGQAEHTVDLVRGSSGSCRGSPCPDASCSVRRAVIGFVERERARDHHCVADIQQVGQRARPAPGVVAHTAL